MTDDSTSLPEVTTDLRSGLAMPDGFTWSAARCGIKQGRPDLGVILSDPPAATAACVTSNKVRAPCVDRNASLVPSESIRALVINSGNANALTGPKGVQTNQAIADELASVLETPVESVLTASTGAIGVPLPEDLVTRALSNLVRRAGSNPKGFAEAIMTTDTVPKVAHLEVTLPGTEESIRLLGVAKGSGMIHPQMATTLAFVCTDAKISPALLKEMLGGVVDDTFNAISVDGDTSTNDMVIAFANGTRKAEVKDEAQIKAMTEALAAVLDSLAEQVARDGEGATRLLEVEVTGAPDRRSARLIARGICRSSLFKCSVFAGQPDFGRVAMAAGQVAFEQKIAIDPTKLTIAAQGIELYSPSGPTRDRGADVIRRLRENVVRWSVDLAQGKHSFVARGCDLSYDYVRINADEDSQIQVSPEGIAGNNAMLASYSPRLRHHLLVEGLAYVRRFSGMKVMVYVPPNVGREDLAEGLAGDLELCMDAGLRPAVSVPTAAMAEQIQAVLRDKGHSTSTVSSDPMRLTRLLDRGHLCVMVRSTPEPSGIVDLAIKIGAQKLLAMTNESGLRDRYGHVQRLSPENFLLGLQRGRFEATHADTLVLARHAMTRGLPALHLLDSRVPHAIVGELFTDDGIGTIITRQAIG